MLLYACLNMNVTYRRNYENLCIGFLEKFGYLVSEVR